jgi:hypothetical protein
MKAPGLMSWIKIRHILVWNLVMVKFKFPMRPCSTLELWMWSCILLDGFCYIVKLLVWKVLLVRVVINDLHGLFVQCVIFSTNPHSCNVFICMFVKMLEMWRCLGFGMTAVMLGMCVSIDNEMKFLWKYVENHRKYVILLDDDQILLKKV